MHGQDGIQEIFANLSPLPNHAQNPNFLYPEAEKAPLKPIIDIHRAILKGE
jgi:hypothetical protein